MASAVIRQKPQQIQEIASIDVRQVGINFGVRGYFGNFPKLEKRERFGRRERPHWRSTATGEISQEIAATEKQEEIVRVFVAKQILVEEFLRESIDVDETTQETAVDEVINQEDLERETPAEESQIPNDHSVEEREISEKEDQHQKSDDVEKTTQETAPEEEFNQEEKDSVVSAIRNSFENPQKSTHDVEEGTTDDQESAAAEKETSVEEPQKPADEREATQAGERETSTEDLEKVVADGDYANDFLFFGAFRTLLQRPQRSIDIAWETAQETPTDQVINQEERETLVEERPESNDRVEERETQEKELEEHQKTVTNRESAAGEELNQEERGGVVSASENPQTSTHGVEEGTTRESEAEEKDPPQKSTDERETTDRKVVAGGERENQDVIKQQEPQIQKIAAEDARQEDINFEGKNYDDLFPKIERKERISKRERRGAFRR